MNKLERLLIELNEVEDRLRVAMKFIYERTKNTPEEHMVNSLLLGARMHRMNPQPLDDLLDGQEHILELLGITPDPHIEAAQNMLTILTEEQS